VNRRTWVTVIGSLTVLLGTAAVAGGGISQQATGSGDELPSALSAHLDQLTQAIPGNGGESNRGPGGADAAFLQALAFPGTDIPLAQLTTAHSAASIAKGRLPKHGSSGWTSIGPSTALYPASPLRTLSLYVPNAYPAAGRVTALALAPTCKPGNCRLWVGQATSGIWRTDDALANHPQWRYLSGSFDINSVGSITVDPADPTGNTLWVGTGEANACRSGCIHGVGLYKTTDGGNTWSGPIAGSVLNGRGTASLAIDPRNSNVMYLSTVRAISGMTSVCCSGVERIVIPGAAPWGVYKSIDGGQTWTYIHAGAATLAGCGNVATMATNTTPCTPIGTRQVAVQVTLPILDGFRREGRAAEQQAAVRESDVRARDLRLQVAADVDGALLDLRSAGAQQTIAAERLQLAAEEVSQARARFKAGVAGNIEVITAQSSLLRARDADIDARFAAVAARIALARSVGSARTLH